MATTHTTITDPETAGTTTISTKIPSQLSGKEIESALAGATKALGKEKGKLSSQGKTIVEDTQALIDSTRKHELFQKLFKFARKAQDQTEGVSSDDLLSAGRALAERVTGMTSAIQTDAADVSDYVRGTIYNYLTSSEYRDLASDLYTITKSLAAQIEDEFQEFDEPSKQPTKGGVQRPWNKPLNLPQLEPSQAQGKTPVSSGKQGEGWKQQQSGTKQRQQQQSKQRQQQQSGAQKQGVSGQESGVMQQSGPKSEAWKLKHQELEDKAIEDIQERLNDFLGRLAEKKEYQSLVQNFFNYSDQVYEMLVDLTEEAKQTPEARQLRSLIDQSYEILADFAGKKNVDKYRKDLSSLLNKVKDDKELKEWRETTRDYILDSLKNPEVEDADKAVEELKNLIRRGRQVLQKYKEDINLIYEDQVNIAQKIRDDPALQEFQQNLTNLGSHLALNAKGEVDVGVMQESAMQVTSLMANLFRNYLATLPITRVEVRSTEYDIVLQDIVVKGTGFAPDKMQISTKSHSVLHFVEGQTNKSTLQVNFSVNNISPTFENFEYWFNKKSFPTYEDSGRATIECGDDGLSINVALLIKSEGLIAPKAYLKELVVRLGFLTLTTGGETHTILTPLLAPLFAESVRSRIETLIYQQLRSRFEDIVLQVNQFFESNPMQRVSQQMASVQANMPSLKEDKKPVFQSKIGQSHKA